MNLIELIFLQISLFQTANETFKFFMAVVKRFQVQKEVFQVLFHHCRKKTFGHFSY